MTRNRILGRSRIAVVSSMMLAMLISLVQAQTTAPSATPAAPPTTGPAGRALEQIMMEIQTTGQELNALMSDPAALSDAARRAEIAPKAIPVLKKIRGYAEELAGNPDPRGAMISKQITEQVRFTLALLADPEATADLNNLATGSDAKAASRAKSMQMFIRWVSSGKDADAQTKILDETAPSRRPIRPPKTRLGF